jgi:hypothetical protein
MLTLMIDVEHGLIDEMLSLDALPSELIDVIICLPGSNNQIEELINYVKNSSSVIQKRFLVALYNTGQKHVNNFILAMGQRSKGEYVNWPLLDCIEGILITKYFSELIKSVDSNSGLLDELLEAGCINSRHQKSVASGTTRSVKNERLLAILLKRSFADYKKFIRCLLKTKQHLVASILQPDLSDLDRPLSDKQISRLVHNNYAALIELVDAKRSDLLSRLLTADCLTRRQTEVIEGAKSQVESNELLLDMIRKGSQLNFDKFAACLRDSGQQHLCPILVEDGIVARMEVKIGGIRTLLYDRQIMSKNEMINRYMGGYEKRIVDEFVALLHNSYERRKQLFTEVFKLNAEVDSIAMCTRHSIIMFYFCRTFEGLQNLNELHSSQQLELILKRSFEILLKCDWPITVILQGVTWDESNYSNCAKFFYEVTSMTVFTEIYAQAHCNTEHIVYKKSATFRALNDSFPYELTSYIVLKAASHLFQLLLTRSSLAEICAMTTLCAVSRLWWRVITHRDYDKRLLTRQFRRMCHPFRGRPTPRLLQTLHIKSYVSGISECNGKLFVCCTTSNTIHVFSSSPPFGHLADVEVPGLMLPVDLSCGDAAHVYIADCGRCAIWRATALNSLSFQHVEMLITTGWLPCSLSTNSRHIIITPVAGTALFLYSTNGVLLKQIELPVNLVATSAMETSHDTYVVTHATRCIYPTNSECVGVSEFDISGRVVRTVNNQQNNSRLSSMQCGKYCRLALAGNDHIIVADSDSQTIVAFTGDLRLKRVLMKTSGSQTFGRLCFMPQTGILFMFYAGSDTLLIQKI